MCRKNVEAAEQELVRRGRIPSSLTHSTARLNDIPRGTYISDHEAIEKYRINNTQRCGGGHRIIRKQVEH